MNESPGLFPYAIMPTAFSWESRKCIAAPQEGWIAYSAGVAYLALTSFDAATTQMAVFASTGISSL